MGRRQNYQLDNVNNFKAFNLDFQPATLSISNPTKFPVYVNVGGVNKPGSLSFTDIIAPYSYFQTDPAGTEAFCIAVDNSSDPFSLFVYPVSITFSTGAASSQSPITVPSSSAVAAQYVAKVKGVEAANLIDFWTLNDLVAASGAKDEISATRNGAYLGAPLPTMQAVQFPDNVSKAPTFVPANSQHINIFTSGAGKLDNVFNGSEGSFLIWLHLTAAHWSDANFYRLATLSVNANNVIEIYKGSANLLTFHYVSGAVSTSVTVTINTSSWLAVLITWSASANRMRAYLNGNQQGLDQTPVGVFAGTLANADIFAFGGVQFAPDECAMVALWTKELTPVEATAVSTVS